MNDLLNDPLNDPLLRTHHALRLEICGVWGSRCNNASKMVRYLINSRTRNKKKLLAEFESILKAKNILL